MKISSLLRWIGIAANGLICAAATIAVLVGTAPLGILLLLVPAALSLLALLPRLPNLAATILASLTNGLLLLIGLFSVVGLGDYGVSPLDVAAAWGGAVFVPAISVLSVLVWRVAAQSNNSSKPNPLRGSA